MEDHFLLLADWADAVRRLKDTLPTDREKTEDIAVDFQRRIAYMRLVRPELFYQRRGEEYEQFTAGLFRDYGETAVMPFLEDEDYFPLCLELRKSEIMRRKRNV